MSVKNIIKAIPITVMNSAAVLAQYQAINPNGLPFPCTILRINNDSNQAIIISYDGATDHEYLSVGQDLKIDAQANSQPNNQVSVFPKGLVVYMRGIAGMGTITLSGYYQPQGA